MPPKSLFLNSIKLWNIVMEALYLDLQFMLIMEFIGAKFSNKFGGSALNSYYDLSRRWTLIVP